MNLAPVRIAVIGNCSKVEYHHSAKVLPGKDHPTIGDEKLLELVKCDIRQFGDIGQGFAISWTKFGKSSDAVGLFLIENNIPYPNPCPDCTCLAISQLLVKRCVPFEDEAADFAAGIISRLLKYAEKVGLVHKAQDEQDQVGGAA